MKISRLGDEPVVSLISVRSCCSSRTASWLFWCIGRSRPVITRLPPRNSYRQEHRSLRVNRGNVSMRQAQLRVGSWLKLITQMLVMSTLLSGRNVLIGKSLQFWLMIKLVLWSPRLTADLFEWCFSRTERGIVWPFSSLLWPSYPQTWQLTHFSVQHPSHWVFWLVASTAPALTWWFAVLSKMLSALSVAASQ